MSGSSLKEILVSQREIKGLSLERLAELTDIPFRLLTNLENGDYEKLPADIYPRVYLKKIAEVLELDHRQLWERYQMEKKNLRFSGAQDRLPANRFSLSWSKGQAFSLKKTILFFFILLILGYLGWQLSFLIGSPQLYLEVPPMVFTARLNLTGQISPQDQLTINGVSVYVDRGGKFSYEYQLQPGINNFEFKVKRIFGKEKTFTKTVFYQTPQ